METKMHVLKNTNDKSTTTIISIPGCAASGVLKSLRDNKILHDYMGLDQEARILMELTLEERHDKLLKQINEHIQQCEEISSAFAKALEELVKKRNEEVDQILADHKKKWYERKKASRTA